MTCGENRLDALRGRTFDLLVIGGGVTGAAVLLEAARRGLRAALVERGDFACGTSSRSSKLVHGGLRYLKEGKIGLTRESVRERQALLRDAPGLVDPVEFLMPHYHGRKPGRATLAFGLALYDGLAGSWQHGYVDRDAALALAPSIEARGLTGAHRYLDATTDDARLVLRLIQEARDAGAVALNYVGAGALVEDGAVRGASLRDAVTAATYDVSAAAIVNATGVFADEVRAPLDLDAHLRPLRGSHLVVWDWRLPVAQSIAFEHPRDGRPVFAYPWLGRTLVGTTDLDHRANLNDEPSISAAEVAYLIEALQYQFPSAQIEPADVISTYAGVRPIVAERDGAPSKASRDHVVWNERGLVTITGGKLTTFRPMALDALAAAAPRLPAFDLSPRPVFTRTPLPPHDRSLNDAQRRRLAGRYGLHARKLVETAHAGELERIGATEFLWAELRWSARREAVVHLDDLLLRRTRIGLLLERGGERCFERVGAICREELAWSDARWTRELADYRERWRAHYSVPA